LLEYVFVASQHCI